MRVRMPSSPLLLIGVMVAALLAGCGTPSEPVATLIPEHISSSAASPLASPHSATPTSSGITSGSITATETDNGHTLELHPGQRIRVVLHSIYWTLQPVRHPDVLTPANNPVTSPQPSGCVAGAGCGTLSAVYDAATPGQAELVATRTSCGEAMGCTAADATWKLTVTVA